MSYALRVITDALHNHKPQQRVCKALIVLACSTVALLQIELFKVTTENFKCWLLYVV